MKEGNEGCNLYNCEYDNLQMVCDRAYEDQGGTKGVAIVT